MLQESAHIMYLYNSKHTQKKPSYLCPQFYHVGLHLSVGLIQIFDFFIQLFDFFIIFDA